MIRRREMSMTANSKHGPTLRATLCEIERGLFYATYRTRSPVSDVHELQTYQVGISASDAKGRIEQVVRALGYETVIWKDALVFPQSHSPARHPARPITRVIPLSK
jgi:hypothetical protein